MSGTETLVKAYLAALAARDFELARTFLADRGFQYTSPITSFDEADRFIQHLSAIGPILDRLVVDQCLTSGSDAIAILDATLAFDGYASYRTAMSFHVAGDRIKAIEAVFDASDYHRMFQMDD